MSGTDHVNGKTSEWGKNDDLPVPLKDPQLSVSFPPTLGQTSFFREETGNLLLGREVSIDQVAQTGS